MKMGTALHVFIHDTKLALQAWHGLAWLSHLEEFEKALAL